MKFRGSIFLSVAIVLVGWLAFAQPWSNAEKEAAIIQSILTGLNYYHFQPQKIDDQFSEKVYELYLERLDGGRRWFTRADVQQLEAFRYDLDDEALKGSYEMMDLAIQLQDKALSKTQTWYREFLDQPFDFSKEESIELDGEKRGYARNDAELKEYWRKLMKYETMTRLAQKLEKKEEGEEEFKDKSFEELEAEARKEVRKTYDDWYGRLRKRKRSDHLSTYLNALTNVFDPHTGYFEPIDKENFDISMSGKLQGIGARLTTEGDYTKVSEVVVGGPAWKQGELEKDDKILKVTQENGESTDVIGMLLDDVVQLIRGEPGTKVTLTLKKKDGTIKDITIVRDVVILEESFARSLLLETPDAEKVGYIWLPRFYADFQDANGRRCSDDVGKEIQKLKKAGVQGIILDLRNNGGGSLRDVVKMSGFFIEKGPIVQVKSRGRKPEVLEDIDARVQYGGPLIVMVNSFSASASEILAAALQDYGRAVIVGAGPSTFGKGTVQRFFDLDRAIRGHNDVKPLGEIKLTIQKFYRINGGATQLRGVEPDIVLPDTYQYIDTGEKEHKYALPWSQIDPVPYRQNVYRLPNVERLKTASRARVENDAVFRQIDEYARRLKERREDSDYPLQLETFLAEEKVREQQNEAFKELFEKEVVPTARNLPEDLPAIQQDESKKARNDEWLKDVKKDVYLAEALKVMHDLLKMH